MKRINPLIAGLVLVLLGLTSQAQNWTTGLVAYYPLDGNAGDATGNGHNGIAFNTQSTTNRFGFPASALAFNGIQSIAGSMIQVTNTVFNLGQSEYTINFWFMPNDLTVGQRTLFQGVNASYGIGIVFNYANSSGYVGYYIGPGNGFWDSMLTYGPKNDFQVGQWYSFSLTKSGQVYTSYINGQFQETHTVPASVGYNFDFQPLLGAGVANGQEAFSGAMDDIRIYNRALSSNEVAQLYAYENNSICTPHKAVAQAQIINGFVVGATVVDGGCGYTNAPLVLIQGGGGYGASAEALIQNGSVTGFHMISAGSGYSTNPPPTFVIASPPFVPTVGIRFSRVFVTQNVGLGHTYVLESSPDLTSWTTAVPQFTAVSEVYTNEFFISQTGQYFRLREVLP